MSSKKNGNRYTEEQKATVLAANAACETRLGTSRLSGFGESTIRSFEAQAAKSPELQQSCEAKKADLADLFERIARKVCARLGESTLIEDCTNLAALNAVGGTAVDKMQLLRGQPTAITGQSEDWKALVKSLAAQYQVSEEQVKADLIEKNPAVKQWVS